MTVLGVLSPVINTVLGTPTLSKESLRASDPQSPEENQQMYYCQSLNNSTTLKGVIAGIRPAIS